MVAPSPDIHAALRQRYDQLKQRIRTSPDLAFLYRLLHPIERRPKGFNDALVRPGHEFAPGLSYSAMLRDRRPLRDDVRTVVVLVDFDDVQFAPDQTADHFARLWFTPGTNSVRDYYEDVSGGLVRIVGQVVGPLRMPHPLEYYAHGQHGLDIEQPNAQTLARDAATALISTGVDLQLHDNDQDGYVDAFVIVHAGRGAERTGLNGDIWSHKWILDGDPLSAGSTTQIYAYLTIPADCRLGVCAHELGHLAFGWPDLYDTDYTSSGVGDWCLMGSGSYNGDEENPAPPSAWCLCSQGWIQTVVIDKSGPIQLRHVFDKGVVVRLWNRDSAESSREYLLIENLQRRGRCAGLPGAGLLVWHIDDNQANNANELRGYKVALEQSDGRRDLEHGLNRGDDMDPYPGVRGDHRRLDGGTNPSTKANNGAMTGITICDISDSADLMTFSVIFADSVADIKSAA